MTILLAMNLGFAWGDTATTPVAAYQRRFVRGPRHTIDTTRRRRLGQQSFVNKDASYGEALTFDTLNRLAVSRATTSTWGTVLMAGAVADLTALTDNSGGTSGSGTVGAVGVTVTDPADTPADADVLRDDLVANTIPSMESRLTEIRNAVATLADYNNDLGAKVAALSAALRAAGILEE